MHQMLQYARFAPQGERGYFSVSRALNYGIVNSVADEQQQLNTDLCLLAQIESAAGLARLDDLAAVPDVDLFIGPADLAASLGYPGNTGHEEVKDAGRRIIASARQHNKLVATACAPADYPFWIDAGVDLLFCTNDIACLKAAAGDALGTARNLLAQKRAALGVK